MDSPVRKMLKRNDYNRHKLLRKIRRLRRAQIEQQKVAAEKELKRRLRVTPPKFGDGKEPTLLDADKVRMNEQGLFLDEAGNIVGDSVVLPELTVRAHKGYKSAYNAGDAFEFAGTVVNSPLQLADYTFNRIIDASKGEVGKTDYRYTPVQTSMQRIGETLSPTRWIGTAKSGFKESPWSENNPGLWGDRNIDMMTDLLFAPKIINGAYEVVNSIKNSPYKLRIPIDKNKYYRIVNGSSAIDDANASGMITRPYIEGSYEFPYFTKGELYSRQKPSFKFDNPYVIVSKENLPFVKVRDAIHTIDESSPIKVGDSATPVVKTNYGTAYNSAPVEGFEYYSKGNGWLGKHFWKRLQFSPFENRQYIPTEALGEAIAEGSEATIYKGLDNPYVVTKVYDGWQRNIDPYKVRDILVKRNSVPGSVPAKIKGYTKNGNPIVEQGRVKVGGDGSKPFTKKQRKDLKRLFLQNGYNVGQGFRVDGVPTKNGYVVRDLSPLNIGYDNNGRLRIIDPDID